MSSSGNEFVGSSAGLAEGVVDLAGDVRLMQRMIPFLVLPSARR